MMVTFFWLSWWDCSDCVLGFDTVQCFRLVLGLWRNMLPPTSGDSLPFKLSVSNIQYSVLLEPKRVQCESNGLLITYYLIISLNTAGKCESYLGGMIQTRIKPEAFPVQESIY